MRNIIIAACCLAFVGNVSVASAQTTGPAGQQTVKATDPMNANAKMKKKKMKKGMMKEDGMSGGMDKGGMSKGGMMEKKM